MAELQEMQEGRRWERGRDIELIAQCVLWLMAPHVKPDVVDFDQMTRSLPGYDLEYQKTLGIDKPQPRPWGKRG